MKIPRSLIIIMIQTIALLLLAYDNDGKNDVVASAGTSSGALQNSSLPSSNVSAIFVFGDSTVDAGNNNHIMTLAKADFLPYGRDYPNHKPTGRFSNGLLLPDMLARHLGLKAFIPPYLDPNLSDEERKLGVCFASAGTGFDNLTAKILNVISLPKQLENFREYKKHMEESIGMAETEILVKEAFYFVTTAGTNDFALNYDGNIVPVRNNTYTLQGYADYVLHNVHQFLQELFDEGGRKIGMVGLPPIGCIPIIITKHSNDTNNAKSRGCVDTFSSVNKDFNSQLQTYLQAMQHNYSHQGSKIAYLDIYDITWDLIHQPTKYGFEVVNIGCCGTGAVELSFLCNVASSICPNMSQYVFWDSVHTTEATYRAIFEALRPIFDSFFLTHVTHKDDNMW